MTRAPDFEIGKGDQRPAYAFTLRNPDGSAVDLAGASVMTLLVWKPGSAKAKVSGACAFVDRSAGQGRYDWTLADTDTAGTYFARVRVEWGDGTKQSFPNRADDPLLFVIFEDVE